MLSFKTFITEQVLAESALERKIVDGFSETPHAIEGADIVHHDPATQTTVYHLKHHSALTTFGTQCRWCTSPKASTWSGKYLRSGNVFGIVKGKDRYQMFVPKKGGTGERDKAEFNNTDNRGVIPKHQSLILGAGVLSKLKKMKHAVPKYDWTKMSDKEAVRELKSLPNDDRLRHFHAIAGTGGVSINPGSTYEKIQQKFDKRDLHHFSDDPDHHTFIAAHAPIDLVAHMKDHPDGETRRVINQRIRAVGGRLLQPEPKSTFQNDPNQLGLDLPKVKAKKKPQ